MLERSPLLSLDAPTSIARDVDAIARISIVPRLLALICEHTGMGFAAIARVTDGTWTACAVEDRIAFGLKPGGQLELQTTLCHESRTARRPIVIDHASEDEIYRDHHTPRIYGIQSYISVPIIFPDGRYFGNLCAIDPRPAKLSDPKTIGLFNALADMVVLQLANDEKYAAVESEVRDHVKTGELREQFIAVLGHDLRNPLAAIGAAAEILSRRPVADDRKLGDRLRASTRRMAGLIDNLMDFARARLGSGLGVVLGTAEALQANLSAVVDEMRSSHPELDIRSNIDIDTPVKCDTGRVQQLLSNLLGNAVHHGASDQPILVRAHVHDGFLDISVCNGGACIDAQDLPKIFQPYWRPENSKPGGGLGLGLYICSEIVRAHGGSLRATSTAAEGTTFTAQLPTAGCR